MFDTDRLAKFKAKYVANKAITIKSWDVNVVVFPVLNVRQIVVGCARRLQLCRDG